MNMLSRTVALPLCLLILGLSSGCSTVTIPPAKSYAVVIGTTQYHATSVKLHGSWVEFETEHGPIWTSVPVIIKPYMESSNKPTRSNSP
jgi:hypothetical protein